jgi:AcrR family transcriptional regulator
MGIQERKEREFLRREEEILNAALRLFNRDDWQSVTIEEVAQAAEIGKGTVYKHFPSKEDIYAHLALAFNRKLLERLRSIDPTLDVIGRLRAVIRVFWETHVHSQEYHRLVQYCEREDFRRNISEDVRAEILQLDEEFHQLVTSLVEQGTREGVFTGTKSPPMMLFGAQAALFGAIRLVRGGCLELVQASPEEFLAEITDFIIAGLTHERVSGSVLSK